MRVTSRYWIWIVWIKIASPEDRPANHCTVHGFIFAQHLLEKVRYSLQTASSVESLLRITQKAVRQNCLSRLKRWLSGNWSKDNLLGLRPARAGRDLFVCNVCHLASSYWNGLNNLQVKRPFPAVHRTRRAASHSYCLILYPIKRVITQFSLCSYFSANVTDWK